MSDDTLLNQAQYIFAATRLIRSHALKTHAKRNTGIAGPKTQELTVTQYLAVMAIDEHGPCTIKALAETLGITPPSASALVDKLVSKKILTRIQNREDRREVRINISPAAAKHIDVLKQMALASYVDLIQKAGPETARKWCEVLEELKIVINKDAEVLS